MDAADCGRLVCVSSTTLWCVATLDVQVIYGNAYESQLERALKEAEKYKVGEWLRSPWGTVGCIVVAPAEAQKEDDMGGTATASAFASGLLLTLPLTHCMYSCHTVPSIRSLPSLQVYASDPPGHLQLKCMVLTTVALAHSPPLALLPHPIWILTQVLHALQGSVVPRLLGVGRLPTGYAFLALGLVHGTRLSDLPAITPAVAAAAEESLCKVRSKGMPLGAWVLEHCMRLSMCAVTG